MNMDGSSGATALLGMDGSVAGAQIEHNGEVWILVETTPMWRAVWRLGFAQPALDPAPRPARW